MPRFPGLPIGPLCPGAPDCPFGPISPLVGEEGKKKNISRAYLPSVAQQMADVFVHAILAIMLALYFSWKFTTCFKTRVRPKTSILIYQNFLERFLFKEEAEWETRNILKGR